MVRGGKGGVRRLKRAQILLAAEAGATDETIAANVVVGTSTVYRTKRRFVEDGLEGAAANRSLTGEHFVSKAVPCPHLTWFRRPTSRRSTTR